MKLLAKGKLCIYMMGVIILSLVFNNTANAEKPLPGLTLEQTQQYGEKINSLIELYKYSPYDSDRYKVLQKEAIKSIKKVIQFRKLLGFSEPSNSAIKKDLESMGLPSNCIKSVINFYNQPVWDTGMVIRYFNDPKLIKRLLENSNKVVPCAEEAINCVKKFLEVQYRMLLYIASDGEVDLTSGL